MKIPTIAATKQTDENLLMRLAYRRWNNNATALATNGWRNIPITLIDTEKGEGKAHACAIACLQQPCSTLCGSGA
jgi:hypothetical protein